MHKTELIDALAAKTGTTKAAAATAVDGVLAVITDSLAAGNPVTLIGFGTFSVGERAARIGRHPRTGAQMTIAAASVPKFAAGAKLKEAVNSKG